MTPIHFDREQRFTCRSCARCCQRPWEIALTSSEVAAYRTAGAARWFRETADGPEGTGQDPFVPLPGALPFGIRKRADDGACGFLSPAGRCRVHEELGAERKPLTCRIFPYQFGAVGQDVVLRASFSCPTVLKNDGETLAAQSAEIGRLRKKWEGQHAPAAAELELVARRPLSPHALATLRSVLLEMLDRPGEGGRPDLPANVDRMARTVEDLSRYRVVRLAPPAFGEYLDLTGRYAARSEKPLPARPPTALGRLLSRGFLFLVLAARLEGTDGRRGGLRLGLRLRLLRLLAHLHGLGPAVAGIDRRAVQQTAVDVADPALHPLLRHYLRSRIETLGSGRRPVIDELCLAVAILNAALSLAALAAREQGSPAVDERSLVAGLTEAADLEHAQSGGTLGAIVGVLTGGVEALYLFAARKPAG